MLQVVGSVRLQHCVDFGLLLGEAPELIPEGPAKRTDPHIVGRVLALMHRHCVPETPEDEIHRVDERAVDVEQECLDLQRRHGRMVGSGERGGKRRRGA